jgi:hypothetical protein
LHVAAGAALFEIAIRHGSVQFQFSPVYFSVTSIASPHGMFFSFFSVHLHILASERILTKMPSCKLYIPRYNYRS